MKPICLAKTFNMNGMKMKMSGYGKPRTLKKLGFAVVEKEPAITCFNRIHPGKDIPDNWEEINAEGFCLKGQKNEVKSISSLFS